MIENHICRRGRYSDNCLYCGKEIKKKVSPHPIKEKEGVQ